jgi:KUP system potassium uptake protein
LYALVKKTKIKWLIVPAIIEESTLADGIITPPILYHLQSADIRTYYPQINTIPIVIEFCPFEPTIWNQTGKFLLNDADLV